jgi:hypothetical protein
MGKEGQRSRSPSRHFLEETQEHKEMCPYLNLGPSEYVARVFPIRLHFTIVVVVYFFNANRLMGMSYTTGVRSSKVYFLGNNSHYFRTYTA